jgi:hypothetical protein
MPTISRGLKQAYDLQDFAFKLVMAIKSDVSEGETVKVRRDEEGRPLDAPAVAQLVKAWESCQQRIQVHRRVPNPGSLKPESIKSKKSKAHSFPTESAE